MVSGIGIPAQICIPIHTGAGVGTFSATREKPLLS
jgi:hypothetical protein